MYCKGGQFVSLGCTVAHIVVAEIGFAETRLSLTIENRCIRQSLKSRIAEVTCAKIVRSNDFRSNDARSNRSHRSDVDKGALDVKRTPLTRRRAPLGPEFKPR